MISSGIEIRELQLAPGLFQDLLDALFHGAENAQLRSLVLHRVRASMVLAST